MNTSILMAVLKDSIAHQQGRKVAYLDNYTAAGEDTKLADIQALMNTLEGKYQHVSKELSTALLALANGACNGSSHVESYYTHIAKQTSESKARHMLRSVLKVLVRSYEDIIIETASELTEEDKHEMRMQLLERHPLSCPRFTTSPQILGGARMFLGGVLYDASWRGEVSRLFTSLSVS